MKKKLRIVAASFTIVGVILGLSACNSARQMYTSGIKKFGNGEYDLAIKDLSKALEANYEAGSANFYIAESYRLSNRFKEALPYWKKVLENDPDNADARFQYAYTLKTIGDYSEALEQFRQVAVAAKSADVLKERASREVEILKIMDRVAIQKVAYEIVNVPLNTDAAEFAPAVLNQELVVSMSRKEAVYKSNGQPMLGIYKVKIADDPAETTGNPALFSSTIFDANANEGSPAFTPDGKTVVFARGNTGKKRGNADVKLYMSRLVNDQWSEPRYLPVNDSLSWDGSPAFSRDGKTLYFASNRPGGVGGIDIYRTNMDASGRFSKPVNMGGDINTAGDEMFPYVGPDNRLYFASDGHPGLGKLDLFVATRSQGVIAVENMGVPFNSPQDDFGLVFYEEESGFFSSNRDGGKGDDDIYYFYMPEAEEADEPKPEPEDPRYVNGELKVIRYFLAGDVLTGLPESTPLDSAFVRIMPDTADVALERMPTDEQGKFGKYRLEEGKSYVLLAERKGYISKRMPFTMAGKSIPLIFLNKAETDTTYQVTIRLDKMELNRTFALDNIYYDLDKYAIRADAAPELDKLVQLLKDNPTMQIELSSHTDARASDAYNMTLSQRRAESVVNYLSEKGIEPERMEAKGYGERNLLIRNAKTEEEHQRNRRTEFTILSY